MPRLHSCANWFSKWRVDQSAGSVRAVSYTVFARKYRPQTFDDVLGQEHITRTLKNAIEQNRLAHAYIFIGPRGTGKTSTARILAKALNCINAPTVTPCGKCDACREIAAGTSLDVLEFDAASNTQVDKIREIIIDNVKYAPTRGKYKLYIVDEVHMLSASSFNALLKTLEEPPEHVKFVFATTNVEKVPTTILSRCQRFDLKRIPAALIARHLLDIAGKEKIELAPDAAATLARGAEGGMRDAESMLDQLVAFCGSPIVEEDVLKIFGFTAAETVATLCDHLLDGNASQALGVIHQQAEDGKDLARLLADLIAHLRDLLVAKADPDTVRAELGEEATVPLVERSARLEMPRLLDLIEHFAEAENRMKWAANRKMHFEIAIIGAIHKLDQASLSDVLDTLSALRDGRDVGQAPRPSEKKTAVRPDESAIKVPARTTAAEPPRASPPSKSDVEEVSQPLAEVREESETPAATSLANASMTEIWSNVVAEIRRARPLVATWAEALALLAVEGEVAIIGYPPEQFVAAESCQRPNIRQFIGEILSGVTGRSLAIRFVERQGLVVAPPTTRREESASPRDPMDEFKTDPLIRKALEIFKAEIQPA